MILSKNESKYRKKFIQEHKFNKSEQFIFDTAKAQLNMTYKKIYTDYSNGYQYMFMAMIALCRATNAITKLGETFRYTTESLSKLARSMYEKK